MNRPEDGIVVCASEAAAASSGAVAPAGTSLATLLASHILRDGEVVLLILKPSLFFIVLSALRFIAVVLILMIAAKVFDPQLPGPNRRYVELGLTCIAARLMWGTLQWMGRFYVLTDMRILSLWGVFSVEIFDCPLRKVARTRLVRATRERLLGVGSIEIIPQEESHPIGVWQMVARPREVREKIIATINRAKQGGMSEG